MSRRVLLPVLLLGAVLAGLLVPTVAQAGAPAALGHIDRAVYNTATHRIEITGWNYDVAKPTAQPVAGIFVNGRYAGRAQVGLASAAADSAHHITGNHGFRIVVPWVRATPTITLTTRLVDHPATVVTLARASATLALSPGDRVVAVAKRYVGKAPYVDGGASPRGFDCSGYTQYAYAQAGVASLPRTADQQRHARGMRIIPASSARPGDLVFYLSGSYVYHVAIYAGNGMQYAAATPQDGIRYQHVWSSAVLYGTDWH